MSNNIDNRIVRMSMDTSKFKTAAANTISTLGILSQQLKMTNGTKGLDDVAKAAKGVDFDPMSKGIDEVTKKFSILDVAGVAAIMNLTNRMVDAGIAFGKSLTVDPIMDGLKEYETKMNAIQTIMTNTASKGTTLNDINEALGELNKYSDQTIYNFAQMTDNIGKATAAGVGLNDSVTFVKGLANVAAGFGVDAMSMAGATQQMTQALASGTVRLQDWMSMENRGMGGEMIQKELLDTARAMGIHVDTSEGFRYSLEQNWLSSEVFIKTMEKMANRQDLVDAATKVKTFTQLVDVMKEAVGSGWAMSWEHIIGDKNESTELFTGISNGFTKIAESMAEYRNDGLKLWKDLGGRQDLLRGFQRIFYSLSNVLGPVYQAFKKVFDPWNGKALADLSKGFKELMEKTVITAKAGEKIGKTFEGIFSIIKLILIPFKMFGNLLLGIANSGGGLIDVIFSLGEKFGIWAENITSAIESSSKLKSVMEYMTSTGENIGKTFSEVFGAVIEVIEEFFSVLGSIGGVFSSSNAGIDAFTNKFKDLVNLGGVLFGVKEVVINVLTSMSNGLRNATEKIGTSGDILTTIFDKIGSSINFFINLLSKAKTSISDSINNISEKLINSDITGEDILSIGLMGGLIFAIKQLPVLFGGFVTGIGGMTKSIGTMFKSLGGTFESMSGVLDSMKDALKAYQTDLKSEALLKIAAAIGILAVSILLISSIEESKMIPATAALMILGSSLIGAMKLMDKISSKSVLKAHATITTAIGFSIACAILAGTLSKLGKMNWAEIGKGMVGLAGVMTLMLATLKIMEKINVKVGVGTGIALIAIAASLNLMSVALLTLSMIPVNSIIKGVTTLASIMLVMAGFSKLVKGSGADVLLVSTSIGILAVSLIAMSAALSILGLLKLDTVMNAFAIISGIAVAVVLLGKVINGSVLNVIAATISLNLLSTSLILFAAAVGLLGSMSISTLAKGLTAIAVSLIIMGVALKLMPGVPIKLVASFLALSVSLVLMATSVAILATAFTALSLIPLNKVMSGLLALVGVIAILGVSAWALSSCIPAIIGISVALGVLGAAVLVTGIGVSLLVTAMIALQGAITVGGLSIVAMIAGLASTIPIIVENIAKGLMALLMVIATNSAGIAAALSSLIKAFLQSFVDCMPLIIKAVKALILGIIDVIISTGPKLISAIITLGLALISELGTLVVGLGELVVSLLTTVVKTVVDSLSGILTSILTSFIQLAPLITQAAILLISMVCEAIIQNAYNLTMAVTTLIGAFLTAIVDNTSVIMETLAGLITAICGAIVEAAPAIVEAILAVALSITTGLETLLPSIGSLVETFLTTLVDTVCSTLEMAIPRFATMIINIITSVCDSVAKNGPKVIASFINMIASLMEEMGRQQIVLIRRGCQMIIDFINGLADTIRTMGPQVRAAVKNLISAIWQEFATVQSKAFGIGGHIITGLKNGINNGLTKVVNAAKNVVSSALNSVKSFLGIHSPSRVFAQIGMYTDEGLVVGMEKGAGEVVDASTSVAKGAVDGMRTAMSAANDLFDVDTTLRPEIRPVVDLSEVQNGVSKMNGMLPSTYGLDVSSNIRNASLAAGSMNSRSLPNQGTTNNNTNTNEIVNHFNISGADDPNTIAQKVSDIINNQVQRRNSVWA